MTRFIIFLFKYFFPKGVSSGSDTNTLGIKKQMKALIDDEDPAPPLKPLPGPVSRDLA